jgi:hypothetical protein
MTVSTYIAGVGRDDHDVGGVELEVAQDKRHGAPADRSEAHDHDRSVEPPERRVSVVPGAHWSSLLSSAEETMWVVSGSKALNHTDE